MEVIQSFTIDHTCLKPGIYVSREDKGFTTFDLRMCKWESRRYIDRLQHDFHSEYTKLQITLDDGRVFADA